ncbi:TadE/TadG family type IV pilus assembly protein [Botrimarina sp.]|uniref:TadE/TadG family type IV pilus assembly protein n=1 Tax=Botrimarina sp. TaxID=2795802 RepID=UPI0032EEF24E
MTPSTTPSTTRPRPNRPRGRGDHRRGVATVEFAFCASILFLLFITMIEVARFHVLRHSMDQAVYMAARAGIVPGATSAAVNDTAVSRLAAAGVRNATLTITPPVITDETQSVTVRAVAPYNENSWTLPKFFDGVQVRSEITLDHENVAFD